MNTSKVLSNIIRQINISKINYKSKAIRPTSHIFKCYSTESTQTEEVIVREKIQIDKPTVTKWKRPPFVPNFFLGKFDTELLAFPEVLDNELVVEVEKYVKTINDLYMEKVNSREIDETGKIPDDLLQDLKDLGLFGRTMPAKYGGLDLSYTACTRLNEVIGLDWSVYSLLTAHEFLASRVILLYGTEDQKNKYLPLLATGKKIAAFCAAELESGGDVISMATSAKLQDDDTYLLRGTKCWVTNADIADVFIVFAKTENPMDAQANEISVFLVDRGAEGISIAPHEKICLRGVKTCIVTFNEVTVPKENLIGVKGEGAPMFMKTMEGFRIAMNSFTFGTLKPLLDSLTDRIINSERVETSLGDIQLVRQRLSRITCMIYAMESLAYYTAAILDTSENPDVILEGNIMKVFNSEGTLYCIRELMELLGSTSLMKEQHLERFHRDALGLHMFDGPNDVIKLFIGLCGCKIAGDAKDALIMKSRNPFFYPYDIFKLFVKRWRQSSGKIKYDQDLAGYIHPSLVEAGNNLEVHLQKLELAVEGVLTEHGRKVLLTQIDPKKLADAVIYMYAQAAVLARSSRSYCIGLKNATQEIAIAGTFCKDANTKVSQIFHELGLKIYRNNEGHHLELGGHVIDCKGYFPENPLKHNW